MPLLLPHSCPWCGSAHDAAIRDDADTAATPKAGDVSICGRCNKVAIYTDSASLRLPNDDDLDDLAAQAAQIRKATDNHPLLVAIDNLAISGCAARAGSDEVKP